MSCQFSNGNRLKRFLKRKALNVPFNQKSCEENKQAFSWDLASMPCTIKTAKPSRLFKTVLLKPNSQVDVIHL